MSYEVPQKRTFAPLPEGRNTDTPTRTFAPLEIKSSTTNIECDEMTARSLGIYPTETIDFDERIDCTGKFASFTRSELNAANLKLRTNKNLPRRQPREITVTIQKKTKQADSAVEPIVAKKQSVTAPIRPPQDVIDRWLRTPNVTHVKNSDQNIIYFDDLE